MKRTCSSLENNKMKYIFLLLLSLFTFQLSAQKDSLFVSAEISMGPIKGTLTSPLNTPKRLNLVILLAGSGPTDRDGNNPLMKNNSQKNGGGGFVSEGNCRFAIRQAIDC
jgi:hypothetical protein